MPEPILSLLIAALMPYLLEWLKPKTWFPFIEPAMPQLNRATAIIAAVATALGVGMDFDATAGVLTITGLKAADLARLAATAIANLAVQQAVYRTAIAPKS